MTTLSKIHWPLLLLKVLAVLGAVGLDLAGRLTPQGGAIILTLVGSLGLVHVAALLKNPPVSPETVAKLSEGLFAMVKELIAATSPPPAAMKIDPDVQAWRDASVIASRGNPPVPPGAVMVLALGAALCMHSACLPLANGPSQADVAQYGTDQLACDAANSTRASIDACRAGKRAAFCTRFPGYTICSSSSSNDSGTGG